MNNKIQFRMILLNKNKKQKKMKRKKELKNPKIILIQCLKITLKECNITMNNFGIKMKLQKRYQKIILYNFNH